MGGGLRLCWCSRMLVWSELAMVGRGNVRAGACDTRCWVPAPPRPIRTVSCKNCKNWKNWKNWKKNNVYIGKWKWNSIPFQTTDWKRFTKHFQNSFIFLFRHF